MGKATIAVALSAVAITWLLEWRNESGVTFEGMALMVLVTFALAALADIVGSAIIERA